MQPWLVEKMVRSNIYTIQTTGNSRQSVPSPNPPRQTMRVQHIEYIRFLEGGDLLSSSGLIYLYFVPGSS